MIIHQENDEKILENILDKLDHETIVRFALVCAEDACDIETSPEAKRCIDLIKEWLLSDKTEREKLKPQLRSFSSDAISDAANSAAFAAAFAANVAADVLPVNAANDAVDSSFYASRVTSSMEEYIQLAKSLLSKTTINAKGTNQDLTVLLDFLEDHGEDLIIRNNQGTFINFPGKHFKLSEKSLNNFEVAELILKNRRLMFYINNMYK